MAARARSYGLGVVRKSQPTGTDVHIDAIIQQVALTWLQNPDNFVSGQVFPIVPVEKQSNLYWKYTKEDWFRDEASRRGESEESAGSGYNVGTDSYKCDVWAMHKDVPWRVQANADIPLQPDKDATNMVTSRLLLRQEIQWAADYFTTGVWTTDKVGTTDFVKWSDYAGSDPIGDIEAGRESIEGITGYRPNTLVLGRKTWRMLKQHPDIRSQFILQDRNITQQRLAELLEVDRVLIARGIKNTSREGAASPSYSFIVASDGALLCYAAPAPSTTTASAGYTFAWRGVSGDVGPTGGIVGMSRIPMPLKKSDRIEGEIAFAHKVVAKDLGYFFSTSV